MEVGRLPGVGAEAVRCPDPAAVAALRARLVRWERAAVGDGGGFLSRLPNKD